MKIVYIDAQNVHRKTLDYHWLIDREKFYTYLKQNHRADTIYYAVGYIEKFAGFYTYLHTLGYIMLFKKVTILPDGTIKGNVDIDIAIRSIFDLFEGSLKKAIIVSNDGDYNTLVDVLKERGVFDRLLVADSHTASKQLKKSAGPYIQDIQRIRHLIEKQKDPSNETQIFCETDSGNTKADSIHPSANGNECI